jgi:leader peptidase (prepilin peptidase) / N-methyltransferase
LLHNAFSIFPAVAAIFGLLIGSFLNVCIYRIVRDQSVVTPRSYCPNCLQGIEWFDNIPVLSYVMLRGKCRHCHEPIGIRYPIVELLTALLFSIVAYRYGVHLACVKWCIFEAILVALCFTDLEERLLPDELTIGGAAAGLILAVVVPISGGALSELLLPRARPVVQSLFEVVAASLLLTLPIWGLAQFWGRRRGREMLGMGDIKLLPLIGAFLGLEHGFTALLIGSISGVVIGGGYILLTRKKAGSYELPLGTFFCLGAGLVPLFNSV